MSSAQGAARLFYVIAHMWLDLAGRGEAFPATMARLVRGELERMMTRDEIIDAQRLARDWKATPADQHGSR